jgi:hypothetical protein
MLFGKGCNWRPADHIRTVRLAKLFVNVFLLTKLIRLLYFHGFGKVNRDS